MSLLTFGMAAVECPACTALNTMDRQFCHQCGALLVSLECPSCGFQNRADAAFCGGCGFALSAETASGIASDAPPAPIGATIPNVPVAKTVSADEQERRRCLELFLGEGKNKYLAFYDKHYRDGSVHGSATSWHWPAFLIALPWLWYRKLFVWGFGLLFTSFAIGLLLPEEFPLFLVTIAIAVGFGLYANRICVDQALKRIREISDMNLSLEEKDSYIKKAGGTSTPAALLGLAVVLSIAMLPLLAVS